jgi:DNA-binding transcriptional LysR family regulator
MAASKLSMKQLQALEAVARTGSFTRAAKALGVSQPSVSNLVYSVERQYRCRLFRRSGQSAEPTETLVAVRSHIKALLSLAETIDRQLAEGRDLQSGRLQIGYTTYQLAIPIVSDFVQRHPGIEINARAMATHDLLPMLFSGSLDAGFITATEIPAGLQGIAIAPARIGLVVPTGHGLAGRERVGWDEVAGLKLIQRETTSGTRRIFEAAARLKNVPLTTVLGLGSWGSIVSLVRSGVGGGVGFERECAGDPELIFVPVADPNLRATHFLVSLPEMRGTAAVSHFFAMAEARSAVQEALMTER